MLFPLYTYNTHFWIFIEIKKLSLEKSIPGRLSNFNVIKVSKVCFCSPEKNGKLHLTTSRIKLLKWNYQIIRFNNGKPRDALLISSRFESFSYLAPFRINWSTYFIHRCNVIVTSNNTEGFSNNSLVGLSKEMEVNMIQLYDYVSAPLATY